MTGVRPARLTAPEESVARLVAEGRTNPGVARALGLTPRAVELHLSRIYHKLGVRTRRDLEAALAGLARADDSVAASREV
jgi:DNA-binding NarL/FixJ family response regulator